MLHVLHMLGGSDTIAGRPKIFKKEINFLHASGEEKFIVVRKKFIACIPKYMEKN